MSKYIVIPIKISLKNNKFAESGGIVDESQLNTNTHDLVSGGFIRLATQEEIEAAEKTEKISYESETDLNPENQKGLSEKDKVKNSLKNK